MRNGLTLILLLILFCGGRPNLVAAPTVVSGTTETGNFPHEIQPFYIDGFELRTNGTHTDLYWWSGAGRCGGEFPSQGKIRVLNTIGGTASLPVADCQLHVSFGDARRVARDDTYVYYSHPNGVFRKRISAAWQSSVSPLIPSSGREMGALTLAGGQLFWNDYDAGSVRIYRANADGTGLQTIQTRTAARIRRLLATSYQIGAVERIETLLILHTDGRLLRLDYNTPGAAAVQLSAGVSDFALRDERTGAGGFALLFTTVYAVVNNTQVSAIRADTGAASVIFGPTTGNNRLSAFAVDDTYAFVLEQSLSTGPGFPVPLGYTLWRQPRPPRNPPGTQGWQPIDTDTAGRSAGFNLRSDGKFVYWVSGVSEAEIVRLPTGTPPIELDFVALGLEAVQTTQDMQNSVRLVANKPTFVRAYARTARNTTGREPLFPGAQLDVFRGGTIVGQAQLVGGGMVDNEADWNVLRADVNRSFLFELRREWVQEGSLGFTFTVNPIGAMRETGAGVNLVSASAQVVRGAVPCLVVAPMHSFLPDYWPGDPAAGFPQIINRALSMLPIPEILVYPWTAHVSKLTARMELGPPLGINVFVEEGPFDFASGEAEWQLASMQLGESWLVEQRPSFCTGTEYRYLGMVPGKIGGKTLNGIAPSGGNRLLVRMGLESNRGTSPQGGSTFAHELGHNYGRAHVDCGGPKDPDPNYPYPDGMVAQISHGTPPWTPAQILWGFDPITRTVIDPLVNSDLMSYCNRWTSKYTWDALLAASGGGGLSPGERLSPAVPAPPVPPGRLLVLSGLLNVRTDSIQLRPFHQFPQSFLSDDKVRASQSSEAAQGNLPYSVRLLDAAGAVLSETPLALVEEADAEGDHRTFLQVVAWPAGTRRVQFLKAGVVRAERAASSAAPVVTVATPLIDIANHTLNSGWSAQDADGDPLVFIVQFTEDDGLNWRTLKSNGANLSANFDTRMLPGSARCRIRVIATDGLNTTIANSPLFSLPRNGPAPLIDGVAPRQLMAFGNPLTLFGLALDGEDGSVTEEGLQWSLTGPTPRQSRGAQFSLPSLSPGLYMATLTATDRDGQSASATREFEIAPLVVPEGPEPVLDGLCADPGYAAAAMVPVSLADGGLACARLFHSGSYLYVCLTDLRFSGVGGGPASVGLLVDTDNDHTPALEATDHGFYVTDSGNPYQTDGATVSDSPPQGFSAIVSRGERGWNAEFRIAKSLLGGWNHPAGILLVHRSALASHWPQGSNTNSPSAWAAAYFGTPPSLSNRPPVAVAGIDRSLDVGGQQRISLDGSASFDPDGTPVSFAWTQVSGPPVTLDAYTSAVPSFVVSASNAPATLRFRLAVSDSQLTSNPAEVAITLRPVIMQQLPARNRGQWNAGAGTFEGGLLWRGDVGDRVWVQATTNLVNWTNLALTSVDFDRTIYLQDPAAATLPYRFYRALGVPSGLVSQWPAEGDAADRVGANNGTLFGVSIAAGLKGQAFNFTAPGQRIEVPASTSLDIGDGTGFTVEGWINPANATTQMPIVEWSGESLGMHLWISVSYAGFGGPGSLYASLNNGIPGIVSTGSGVIQAGVWQHIAITWDADSEVATLYRNGAQVATSRLSGQIPVTSAKVYLGARPGGPTFRGRMDELSIYARTLTGREINDIYISGGSAR